MRWILISFEAALKNVKSQREAISIFFLCKSMIIIIYQFNLSI